MAIDLNSLLQNFREPQLQFQWEIIMPDIQGVGSRVSGFAQEVELPHGKVEFEGYHRYNTKRYDPGFTDVDSVNITFVENTYNNVINYLTTWKDIVADSDGFYGAPEEYKQIIEVHMLNAMGDRNGTKYECQGMWPSTINAFSLGHGSEILQVACEFSCDNIAVTHSLRGPG